MRHTLPRTRRQLTAALLAAVLAATAGAGLPAAAAPVSIAAPKVEFLRIGERTTTRGTLEASFSISLARAASSMSVRYRLYTADGSVAFQQSETLRRVDPGTRLLTLSHDLSGLGVREGVCRVEAVVRVAGAPAVTVSEPVYVVDAARAPLPVAVVVRFSAMPSRDPAGRFLDDPAVEPSARTEADALARLAALRPDLRLSLAIPPLMLDEWAGVGAGYSLAATGTTPVPAGATAPSAARATLDALREAVRSGALSLLGIGYADPEPRGLERIGALDDLSLQLARGAVVASETLGVRPHGVALSGGLLPGAALPALAARRTAFVLLAPDGALTSVQGRETTAAPGTYAIADTTMTALVYDPRASFLLAGAAPERRALLDHLFVRFTSKATAGAPVVAVIDVGPGASARVDELQATLALVARTGWIRLVTAPQAAALVPRGAVTLPATSPEAGAEAPPFWTTLATVRAHALAFADSAGREDPDVAPVTTALMIAESAAWWRAGADPGRGQAYAAAADERAWGALSKATLAIPNVTLSGSAGRIPVSVNNGSGRPLSLTLRMVPKGLRLPRGKTMTFTAMPGENIQSIQVDMGSTLAGSIRFELLAGGLTIASGDSTVRASYIDRLVVLGSVVMVLLLLLWYIRRKGRTTFDRLREVASRR